MKSKIFATGVFGLLCAQNVAAEDLPYVFSSGQTASASQVNANFNAVNSAIENVSGRLTSIENTTYSTTIIESSSDFNPDTWATSEIVTATCPTGTVITGMSIECSSENKNVLNTNFGVVSASSLVGNSAMGYCYAEYNISRIDYYGPAITVYAACLDISSGTSASTKSISNTPITLPVETLEAIELTKQEMRIYQERRSAVGK